MTSTTHVLRISSEARDLVAAQIPAVRVEIFCGGMVFIAPNGDKKSHAAAKALVVDYVLTSHVGRKMTQKKVCGAKFWTVCDGSGWGIGRACGLKFVLTDAEERELIRGNWASASFRARHGC